MELIKMGEKEEVVNAAMEIIIHAGDARLFTHKALGAIAEDDYQKASENLASAKNELVEAHKVHTMMIQSAARGIDFEYSLLFTHAQDTLMTINSEVTLTRELLKVFESLSARIAKLENQ